MFARFDENPAMTLRVIKETKRYGRTHGRTHARTDNVKTVYPLQTKFAGGIIMVLCKEEGSSKTAQGFLRCCFCHNDIFLESWLASFLVDLKQSQLMYLGEKALTQLTDLDILFYVQ